MKLRPRTLLIIIALFLSSMSALGQGFSVESKSPPAVNASDFFMSLEGRFSIALPANKHGFQPLAFDTPTGRVTGDAFTWNMKEARFSAGYVDTNQILVGRTDKKDFFDRLRDGLLTKARSAQGKLIREKDTSLNDHPGREMKFELADGVFMNRVYLVANRMYQMTAILKGEQVNNDETVVKVFDSFKLLSQAEFDDALKRKIAEATPAPLPQEPVAKRARSDTEDAGLKGKVKSVLSETENFSSPGKRKPTSVEHYNHLGNLTKSEGFDWKGNLTSITVYGYIDGDRVAKYGHIQREYNPPPIMIGNAPGEPDQPKPIYDSRFSSKFKYKYDDQKRRIEQQTFSNDGKLTWRCMVSFTRNQREETCYSGEKPYRKTIATLDKDGNELETVDIDPKDGSLKNKRSFSYEYDSHGNWIRKTSSKWITKDGRSYYEPATLYTRTITYY